MTILTAKSCAQGKEQDWETYFGLVATNEAQHRSCKVIVVFILIVGPLCTYAFIGLVALEALGMRH